MNFSTIGFHTTGRFSSLAMLPKLQTVQELCPTSTGTFGSIRERIELIKVW